MRIVVVGAAGFIGRAVVDRLAAGALGPVTSLTLLDLSGATHPGATRVVEGSYCDAATRSALFAEPADLVFHLASLAGGAAEQDFAKGRGANLDGTLALLDAAAASSDKPRIVYASSIAALDMGRQRVVADDALRPNGSYGTHKAMVELYLADRSRRGELDGRSVRPSGVVARPLKAYAGFATWWMSDLFRAAFEGRQLAVPVAAQSVIWLQSVAQTADNIIHAARISNDGLPAHRAWTLPPTVTTVADIASALQVQLGRAPQFSYGDTVMALPPIDASDALSMGFGSDGGASDLVANVIAQLEAEYA